MNQRLRATLVLATLALLLMVAVAQAAVTVSIDPSAKRVKGGRAVSATVTITCDPGLEPLEGQLTVSQDNQTITGTGGVSAIQCDGSPHKHLVVVQAQEGRYHRGEANGSAFVLLFDPSTGTTQQGQDSKVIIIR